MGNGWEDFDSPAFAFAVAGFTTGTASIAFGLRSDVRMGSAIAAAAVSLGGTAAGAGFGDLRVAAVWGLEVRFIFLTPGFAGPFFAVLRASFGIAGSWSLLCDGETLRLRSEGIDWLTFGASPTLGLLASGFSMKMFGLVRLRLPSIISPDPFAAFLLTPFFCTTFDFLLTFVGTTTCATCLIRFPAGFPAGDFSDFTSFLFGLGLIGSADCCLC
jgi:hypothetical protein